MRALSVSLCALFAVATFPLAAAAEHNDVITVKLNEGCSVEDYVKIKDDFNAMWGKDNGYRAEIAVPIQATDLTTVFWIGHTANATAFGNAWDVWRDALADSKSIPAKLNARFAKCGTNLNRSGFDVL